MAWTCSRNRKMSNAHKKFGRKPTAGRHLEDLDVNDTILKWIKKWDLRLSS